MAVITHATTSILPDRKLPTGNISWGDGNSISVPINELGGQEVTLITGQVDLTYIGVTIGEADIVRTLKGTHTTTLLGGTNPVLAVNIGIDFTGFLSAFGLSDTGTSFDGIQRATVTATVTGTEYF